MPPFLHLNTSMTVAERVEDVPSSATFLESFLLDFFVMLSEGFAELESTDFSTDFFSFLPGQILVWPQGHALYYLRVGGTTDVAGVDVCSDGVSNISGPCG